MCHDTRIGAQTQRCTEGRRTVWGSAPCAVLPQTNAIWDGTACWGNIAPQMTRKTEPPPGVGEAPIEVRTVMMASTCATRGAWA